MARQRKTKNNCIKGRHVHHFLPSIRYFFTQFQEVMVPSKFNYFTPCLFAFMSFYICTSKDYPMVELMCVQAIRAFQKLELVAIMQVMIETVKENKVILPLLHCYKHNKNSKMAEPIQLFLQPDWFSCFPAIHFYLLVTATHLATTRVHYQKEQ